MAKKKNNNKNKGDGDAQQKAAAAAAAPVETQQEPAAAGPAAEPTEPVEQPADASSSSPAAAAAVEDMSIEQLRAEVLSQRQQLAAKDAELAQLKAQLQQGGSNAAQPLAVKSYPDVDSLRSRLEALRKEQEEADSARDKAWSQLKRVVGEISKLASPDYVTSLVQKSQGGDGKNDLDVLVVKAE